MTRVVRPERLARPRKKPPEKHAWAGRRRSAGAGALGELVPCMETRHPNPRQTGVDCPNGRGMGEAVAGIMQSAGRAAGGERRGLLRTLPSNLVRKTTQQTNRMTTFFSERKQNKGGIPTNLKPLKRFYQRTPHAKATAPCRKRSILSPPSNVTTDPFRAIFTW